MRSFEERRGKYIFSTPSGIEPENLNLNIDHNYFYGLNNGNCTFSITVADDNETVYFDLENCAVISLERFLNLKKLERSTETFLGRLKEAWRILTNTTGGK